MDAIVNILISLGVDQTVGIQFIVFAVVYIFLSQLLFKPYFSAYKERQNRTEGNMELAERLVAETQELETIYQKKARNINSEHKKIYDKSRSEALHEHDQIVAEARAKARSIVDKTKSDISDHYKVTREELAKEAPIVSKEIVNRLVGKELIQ